MAMCEYDRSLLREIKNVLYEIRDELKETNSLQKTTLDYVVQKTNKTAMINQNFLRYQLRVLENANEDD